ncbi:MAG: hypothetical protein R2874_00835 [Desulfobacterales bacterium]
MQKIKTAQIKNTSVTVPGSKSYTHRILIASAWLRPVPGQNWLDSGRHPFYHERVAAIGGKHRKDG